ncbi:hypothetical protein ABIB38_002798 [Massilia sp. UYP11]|uniref:hypothetical protein n=1 Tax=Massilia sp. UYP11 TaxID=1756385 RepID=UPI003D1FBD8A
MTLTPLFSSLFSHIVNIDGTPMIPDTNIDINGNPFGVADNHFSTDTTTDMFGDSGSLSSFSAFDN